MAFLFLKLTLRVIVLFSLKDFLYRGFSHSRFITEYINHLLCLNSWVTKQIRSLHFVTFDLSLDFSVGKKKIEGNYGMLLKHDKTQTIKHRKPLFYLWLPAEFRIKSKIVVITHQAQHRETPEDISDLSCPFTNLNMLTWLKKRLCFCTLYF